MICLIIAINAAIGLHEAAAQHRELTKDNASTRSAMVNAALFGTFAAVFWPVGVAFFCCARYARADTPRRPAQTMMLQTVRVA